LSGGDPYKWADEPIEAHTGGADIPFVSPPGPQQTPKRSKDVDLITYWERYCAPFLRARFSNDERGASLVEYALLVALIAVVCIGAVTVLGGNANNKFSQIGSAVGG